VSTVYCSAVIPEGLSSSSRWCRAALDADLGVVAEPADDERAQRGGVERHGEAARIAEHGDPVAVVDPRADLPCFFSVAADPGKEPLRFRGDAGNVTASVLLVSASVAMPDSTFVYAAAPGGGRPLTP
jgi:hypothetical protein